MKFAGMLEAARENLKKYGGDARATRAGKLMVAELEKQALAEFVEYCWEFYGPGQIYGEFFGHRLTRVELEAAARERMATADFAGDSFDREAVRDAMLAAREAA